MASPVAFTGHVPHNYDTYLGPLFFEPYAINLASRLQNNHYQSILEIACGTGRVTKHLLPKLSAEGKLVATDLNEAMLTVSREKIKNPRVEWKIADAQNLPFNDEEFDLVVCQFGVMFFPDKPKAFGEAFRVLKSAGMFFFNTWDRIEENALADVSHAVLKEFFPDGSGSFMEKGPHGFYDTALITQLLQDAGFGQISIDTVRLVSTAATADECVNGILGGTPLNVFLSERNADKEPIKKRLRDELQKRYGTTNLQLPMQAFVCTATKGCKT
ncbi:class I SAM-dependent methyltransferase [Flavisolibacter ginsenosidimutans]|uniref:Class I SAM-dependent methyltransferase n=1 Tax=Flavisolibacter ginsenosidimutans TaxID=661481 RepID=A0A5B8UMF5_9BACT|nr:class I SAM-dependent methyltransferase [Flavisolibacter ginsenosidimutans]QEC57844.1 class I SAM-dependent methyltransferase [Flavisolibacter ginsenosidimutans]